MAESKKTLYTLAGVLVVFSFFLHPDIAHAIDMYEIQV